MQHDAAQPPDVKFGFLKMCRSQLPVPLILPVSSAEPTVETIQPKTSEVETNETNQDEREDVQKDGDKEETRALMGKSLVKLFC